MSTYGQDATTSALVGFLAFLIDLGQIIDAINEADISDEALASAKQFAEDCNTVLADIKAGMVALNSLQYVGTEIPDLSEAGKALVKSLADGFIENGAEQLYRIADAISTGVDELTAWIKNVCAPLMYDAGYGLGVAFIQGWIDGLNNNAGTLYAVIQAIVQNAIAAAEAAAGVASRSQVMFDFGNQMTQGLIEGLQAQQSGVISALTGMLAVPDMVLSPQLVGAGGGGDTYQYTYQEAEGRGARERNIRQDFEAMEFYQRMRS